MSTFRPIVLVTGGSSGIGAALARVFAENNHEVVLVARNGAQLDAVADDIGARGLKRPHVLPIDLMRLDSGARIGQELAARGLEPAFIVNNAGFGLVGGASVLDRAEQLDMIDLNIRALTDLSLRFVGSLQRHRGGLLNVASVAAFLPGPGMAVYYASKAYVLSFTEALHHELASKGVRVTALCPGPVPTGFQDRAGVVLSDRVSAFFSLPPEQVARAGYAALMAGQRVMVPGFANKLVTTFVRFIPHSILMRFADERQRKRKMSGTPWSQQPL
ncbi:MAG: SDR family oxidoreductase [Rhizobiales bacterium]|nr:SDR family oxidoreductase [Hyphomicrobiales bacterium]